MASELRRVTGYVLLAGGLTFQIARVGGSLVRLALAHQRELACFANRTRAIGRVAMPWLLVRGLTDYLMLFGALTALPSLGAIPERVRLRRILRGLRSAVPSHPRPLRGRHAKHLNAAMVRFSFRRWLGLEIAPDASVTLARYGSAAEAVVRFLEYCRVEEDDWVGLPNTSAEWQSAVAAFADHAAAHHARALGRILLVEQIRQRPRGALGWRTLAAAVRQRLDWAGLAAVQARVEQRERAVWRSVRSSLARHAVAAELAHLQARSRASEDALLGALATQLSLNAFHELLALRRTVLFPTRYKRRAFAVAAAALTSHLASLLDLTSNRSTAS